MKHKALTSIAGFDCCLEWWRNTKRVQLSRKKGWRLPEETVVVARPTKWGNPFKVVNGNRAAAVEEYKQWLTESTEGKELLRQARAELRGKDLACWCPLDGPCHAEVLLRLVRYSVGEGAKLEARYFKPERRAKIARVESYGIPKELALLTQSEVGQILGLSQGGVNKVEKEALTSLRRKISRDEEFREVLLECFRKDLLRHGNGLAVEMFRALERELAGWKEMLETWQHMPSLLEETVFLVQEIADAERLLREMGRGD